MLKFGGGSVGGLVTLGGTDYKNAQDNCLGEYNSDGRIWHLRGNEYYLCGVEITDDQWNTLSNMNCGE